MTQTDRSQRRFSAADRWSGFGESIFATITARARQTGAINLGQGMPEHDGPGWIKDAGARALREHPNQYVPMPGVPALRAAIADRFAATWGETGGATGHWTGFDPDTEVTVTNGCTGALASTMLGVLDPGDEVVVFEPFYDAYLADIAMAGAHARTVPLRMQRDGSFAFDPGDLRRAVTARTRAVLINTPHNPTGKVFDAEELRAIAAVCLEHDLIAIADEVYDHHVYEGEHVRIASLDGMRERTISLGSFGKIFSMTGWKIGWAIAPPGLTGAVRAAHQFLAFCVAAPLQHAAAEALRAEPAYYEGLRAQFTAQRDALAGGLAELGFRFQTPRSGYFILADHTALSEPRGIRGDVAFCNHLIDAAGVACIPPSSFYRDTDEGERLVRVAFCVSEETIGRALERLRTWAGQAS